MVRILTIVGPTGVGKTRIAIDIAKRINGEIVSADSRQIYKFLDIGTAKPTPEERAEVIFHLIDLIEPDQSYSCGQYARDAETKIAEIINRKAVPIVCGGTGLYIGALFSPLHSLPESDPVVKEKLIRELKKRDLDYLYQRLTAVDPEWAKKVKPQDKQRILRGLEVYEITGKPLSSLVRGKKPAPKYEPLYAGLYLSREELYRQINQRFDRMIKNGFIDEVKAVLQKGYSPECNGLRTIGYKEMIAFLDGKMTLVDAIEKTKQSTRNFAKRQITWFNKLKEVKWFDAGTPCCKEMIKIFGNT